MKYQIIIECKNLEIAKKIGELIVNEIPIIRSFKINKINQKTQNEK